MAQPINFYVSKSLPFDPAPLLHYEPDVKINTAIWLLTLATPEYSGLALEDITSIREGLAGDWNVDPSIIGQLDKASLVQMAMGLLDTASDQIHTGIPF